MPPGNYGLSPRRRRLEDRPTPCRLDHRGKVGPVRHTAEWGHLIGPRAAGAPASHQQPPDSATTLRLYRGWRHCGIAAWSAQGCRKSCLTTRPGAAARRMVRCPMNPDQGMDLVRFHVQVFNGLGRSQEAVLCCGVSAARTSRITSPRRTGAPPSALLPGKSATTGNRAPSRGRASTGHTYSAHRPRPRRIARAGQQ